MVDQPDSIKIFSAQLVLLGCLFCVLFGQGLHIHEISLHLTDHLDIHAHVHAHESHEEPARANTDHDKHQHEVSTTSDITGKLAPSIQVKTDLNPQSVLSPVVAGKLINQEFEEIPTLFDLPPPRPSSSQYHLSSFSHRGPPVA